MFSWLQINLLIICSILEIKSTCHIALFACSKIIFPKNYTSVVGDTRGAFTPGSDIEDSQSSADLCTLLHKSCLLNDRLYL